MTKLHSASHSRDPRRRAFISYEVKHRMGQKVSAAYRDADARSNGMRHGSVNRMVMVAHVSPNRFGAMSAYVAVCASVTIFVFPRIATAGVKWRNTKLPPRSNVQLRSSPPGTASKLAMNSEIAGGDACGRFAGSGRS
jgi:hypothetical protein